MTDIRLGVIADDYTGASDVGAALRAAGMNTRLLFGRAAEAPGPMLADAIVVGSKTRSAEPTEAIATAVGWLAYLRQAGADEYYFKYCSTFDSTVQGNIGPVADALIEATGVQQTIVCPAAPGHGRTVYQGHLFVGSHLLADSPMRDHPVTPMRDSRLERLLTPQTRHTVGALRLQTLQDGVDAVRRELLRLRAENAVHVVADALTVADLDTLASARDPSILLTGAVGLAESLAKSLTQRRRGSEPPATPAAQRPMIVAGSCSPTTLRQVALVAEHFPHCRVSPLDADDPDSLSAAAADWVDAHRSTREPLVLFASAPPVERARSTHVFGDQTGAVLERTLANAARHAVATAGVDRVIVAGGETSGAVIDALGIGSVEVGAELDPGVPWLLPGDSPCRSLILKSGNFGADDILLRAAREVGE